MRAIPSPVERTMPVSRTSSRFSYSRICSRMMSLISAARICISLFPPARGSVAALGHVFCETRELRPQAPVVDDATDVEDDSAQELRIDLRGGDHLPASRE